MKKETRLVIINILISIWSITEEQPNHLVLKKITKARIEPTVMSTQKVSSFSCPGSCWGNEMQTWQLHFSPGKTELSTQVQRWLESLSGLSTIEHTSWKTKSTVEMTRCCRIWPHNLSEKVPDAVGVSVLLQGPLLRSWEACSAYPGPLDLWELRGRLQLVSPRVTS